MEAMEDKDPSPDPGPAPPTAGNISVGSPSNGGRMGPGETHWVVRRSVVREGDRRGEKPRFGATGKVAVSGVDCARGDGCDVSEEELTGDFFYSKYLNRLHSGEVQVGNADTEVDKALELCVRAMRPGEKCVAVLGARVDLWRNGRRKTGEEDGSGAKREARVEVECELTLESVLNAQPIHKWYPETKFDKAQEANAAAVRLFKLGRTVDAFHKFHLTLTLLTFVVDEAEAAKKKADRREREEGGKPDSGDPAAAGGSNVSDDLAKQASDLSLTCLSNLAACHFQWGNHAFVAKLASRVLERQPANVKLLYRRGVARLEMRDFEASRADLVEAHRLDPSNKAINDKMGVLRIQEKKHKELLAGGMKKMFA